MFYPTPARSIGFRLACMLALLGSLSAHGEVPQSINFQALITDELGSAVEGPTDITVTLYNADGTARWTDTQTVDVVQGRLSVQLGRVESPFPIGLFDVPLLVGVKVGSDEEMVPRQALISVAYAFRAQDANTVGGVEATTLDQSAHVGDTANPHGVTAAQAGAATQAQLTAAITARIGASGHITSVTAGEGLVGGANSGAAAFAINPATTQRRVSGTCEAGQSVRLINADGTVVCEVLADSDTNAATLCDAGQFLDGNGACVTGSVVRVFSSNNTASGTSTLPSDTTGGDNTANGTGALFNNSAGDGNTANGSGALNHNTTGGFNTASGVDALLENTTGSNNTANGVSALQDNTTGNGNTANGVGALQGNITGEFNTACGANTLVRNTTGERNTASGVNALVSNISGSRNTACGVNALELNTTGNDNVAIGVNAGRNNRTGNGNIYIGNLGQDESDTTRIGVTQTRAFIAGVRGVSTTADAIPVLVDSTGQLGTVSSSERFKEDIRDMGKMSTRLLSLRPVAFRYRAEVQPGIRPLEYGLIAEEVAKVMPELVVYDADGKPETVRYHVLSTLLLNELQAANHRNDADRAELQAMRHRELAVTERLTAMESTVRQLVALRGDAISLARLDVK